MKIYKEISLNEFEFWGGAQTTVELLTFDEIQHFEEMLDFSYNFSETEINDIFWFANDWIAKELGYEDFEQMYTQRRKKQ